MAPFPYIDLRACADLRVLLARELANARQWRCEFTEAKAHSAEAITSSRKLMAELDAVPRRSGQGCAADRSFRISRNRAREEKKGARFPGGIAMHSY